MKVKLIPLPQLHYGDKAFWITASKSILSSLPSMHPEDVRRASFAAASNVASQAASSIQTPHRYSPEDPFSPAFWSGAEQIVSDRIRSNELDDLQAASVLRSFSLAASHLKRGKVGSKVWDALSERLIEKQGGEELSKNPVLSPPLALVELAWSCAVMREGFGWQGNSSDKGHEDPALSFFLSHVFATSTQSITHFNLKQIESLLSAASIALDEGKPQPSVLPPLTALTAMVSDVIEIRGFEWQGSGAIPTSSGSESHHKASSACHVLHLLAKVGSRP